MILARSLATARSALLVLGVAVLAAACSEAGGVLPGAADPGAKDNSDKNNTSSNDQQNNNGQNGEQTADQPVIVAGAYLTCQPLVNPSAGNNEYDVGCRVSGLPQTSTLSASRNTNMNIKLIGTLDPSITATLYPHPNGSVYWDGVFTFIRKASTTQTISSGSTSAASGAGLNLTTSTPAAAAVPSVASIIMSSILGPAAFITSTANNAATTGTSAALLDEPLGQTTLGTAAPANIILAMTQSEAMKAATTEQEFGGYDTTVSSSLALTLSGPTNMSGSSPFGNAGVVAGDGVSVTPTTLPSGVATLGGNNDSATTTTTTQGGEGTSPVSFNQNFESSSEAQQTSISGGEGGGTFTSGDGGTIDGGSSGFDPNAVTADAGGGAIGDGGSADTFTADAGSGTTDDSGLGSLGTDGSGDLSSLASLGGDGSSDGSGGIGALASATDGTDDGSGGFSGGGDDTGTALSLRKMNARAAAAKPPTR